MMPKSIGAERDQIRRDVLDVHQDEGDEQRQRNDQPDDDRAAPAAEEDDEDEEHEHGARREVLLDRAHGVVTSVSRS